MMNPSLDLLLTAVARTAPARVLPDLEALPGCALCRSPRPTATLHHDLMLDVERCGTCGAVMVGLIESERRWYRAEDLHEALLQIAEDYRDREGKAVDAAEYVYGEER